MTDWIKLYLPELNLPQRTLLELKIQEIIGSDIDTQALVQAGEREQAKYGFEINAEKKQQRMRLNKAFGIPEPPEPDNRWWLSDEEKAKEKK